MEKYPIENKGQQDQPEKDADTEKEPGGFDKTMAAAGNRLRAIKKPQGRVATAAFSLERDLITRYVRPSSSR
ncbi:MAG: hypothetical protein ABFS39_14460 [Pseudomonadota bacterium]